MDPIINYGYVIFNPVKYNFIGLDDNSGGYPTFSNFLGSSKIWINKEEAQKYISIWTKQLNDPYNFDCHNWVILKIEAVLIQ